MEQNIPIEDKRPVGRPPLYATAEELQSKIDEYFSKGMNSIKKFSKLGLVIEVPTPTISGLVLYCGFCDRHSFYDLEKKPGFSHTIKKARLRIEMEYEQDLKAGLGAGAIFALKNFGWKDEQGLNLGNPDGSPLNFPPLQRVYVGKPDELPQ